MKKQLFVSFHELTQPKLGEASCLSFTPTRNMIRHAIFSSAAYLYLQSFYTTVISFCLKCLSQKYKRALLSSEVKAKINNLMIANLRFYLLSSTVSSWDCNV